ncbi:GDP-mannose 4,6-dehydratase [Actinomadura fulvescens]|uniref:GDP-mannose 4,6-dehydratase n=1 Tax=Actinomadura fulvescens TaxID=46160 RepID=A0ABN3Q1N5_9ACTN
MRLPFRRAVITGGAGFLGSHLCGALLRRGVDVVCVDDFCTSAPENVRHLRPDPGFSLVRNDVSVALDVPGHVDLVMHLASPASPADYRLLPIATLRAGSHGTTNALELAARKQARFVLASTSEVYGDPHEHPQRESYPGNVDPVGPRSCYDEAKRFAEALTTAYRDNRRVDTVIVRIFNSYGPRMRAGDGRVVPTFICQALAGSPLTVAGDGSQTRSLCFVDDTIDGLLAAATRGHRGPVNIGSPEEVEVLALARRVKKLTGSASAIEFVERPPGDPERRRPDTTLAGELLGWRPRVSLDEGIGRTVSWFRRHRGTRPEVIG